MNHIAARPNYRKQAASCPLGLAFSVPLNGSFNGEDAVASYLNNVRPTKETTMHKRADDMNVHDEWISCSHWGMFPLERNPSN